MTITPPLDKPDLRSSFGQIFRFIAAAVASVTMVESLTAATAVSQFGITWNFSENRTVGQYANGDWWVVGPVTITSISPESTTVNGWTKNGTMTNFSFGWAHGFDSSSSDWLYYAASLNVAPGHTGAPLVVTTPTSVVSSISQATMKNRPQWLVCAVLTVVNSAPAPGAFRPAIASTDKTHYWNKSQLNYGILKKLPPVPSTPNLDVVKGYFEKPWFAHMEGVACQYISPLYNMPNYGRDQAHQVSDGILSLHLNYTNAQKEQLYIRMVQYGIDIYGAMLNRKDAIRPSEPYIFSDNAGLNAGRKAPLVLAAMALNDPGMKVFADAAQKFYFSEDRQTWIVSQYDVGRYVKDESGPPEYKPREKYRQEHVGLAEWGDAHTSYPERDDSRWNTGPGGGAAYRFIVGGSVIGNALGIRLLTDGEKTWNHRPFFSYMDRYWTLETLNGSSFDHQSMPWPNRMSRFVFDMWNAYSGALPPPVPDKAATPQFSPAPGNYDSSQSVSISCATAGVTIRYTSNGSDPTASSAVYTAPLTLTSNTTLKARAYKTGIEDSAIATATYTFGVAAPSISPSGANLAPRAGRGGWTLANKSLPVTLSCSTAGATIYYTTDGTKPSKDSKQYTGPFDVVPPRQSMVAPAAPFYDPPTVEQLPELAKTLIPSITVKAVAIKSGLGESPMTEALFNFGPFSSGPEWLNVGIEPTGTNKDEKVFDLLFDYVPGADSIDGVAGISGGKAKAYTDLFCVVRFNSGGMIDARNGSVYSAVEQLTYKKGIRYRVEMIVDMAARTYSVRVLDLGKYPHYSGIKNYKTIAKDYAFRTEQSAQDAVESLALMTIADQPSLIHVLGSRTDERSFQDDVEEKNRK